MEIDRLVETLSWRDVLYEVMSQMDPWDVDIGEVATRYSRRVEQMQRMDFRVPATVLLVSSVLLRMKSYSLRFTELEGEEPYNGADEFDEYMDLEHEDFEESFGDEIQGIGFEGTDEMGIMDEEFIMPRRVPKRKITAVELIAAIREVLGDKRVKKRMKARDEPQPVIIPDNPDIKRLIDDVYKRIMKILYEQDMGAIRFSELVNRETGIVPVRIFICLLHLANDQKLRIKQRRMFEDIFISKA